MADVSQCQSQRERGRLSVLYRVESIYTWQCGGLAYPTPGCKVVPYAGVSLVAAKSSPKRRYVPLVDDASSRHCALSAQLPG